MERLLPRSALASSLWIAGLAIWILGHAASAWLTRTEPQFIGVFARHLPTVSDSTESFHPSDSPTILDLDPDRKIVAVAIEILTTTGSAGAIAGGLAIGK